LKRSGDKRKGMKREVVKQTKRMRVRGSMGKKWKNLKGGVTIHHHLFISTHCNYEFANDDRVLLFSFSY
jgi:hypothetical protein